MLTLFCDCLIFGLSFYLNFKERGFLSRCEQRRWIIENSLTLAVVVIFELQFKD